MNPGDAPHDVDLRPLQPGHVRTAQPGLERKPRHFGQVIGPLGLGRAAIGGAILLCTFMRLDYAVLALFRLGCLSTQKKASLYRACLKWSQYLIPTEYLSGNSVGLPANTLGFARRIMSICTDKADTKD